MRARRCADQPDVVGRDDHGRAQPVERREQMEQPLRHLRIDIAGRLVGDQQVGPVDHRARDRDALLLAARQRRRARAGPVAKADPGEHFAHRSLDLVLAGAADAQRQGDIVERREMADQAEILEHHPDPPTEARQRIARRIAEFLAEQADAPARRPLGQIKQLQQRRLARARRAGEKIKASVGERKSRSRSTSAPVP